MGKKNKKRDKKKDKLSSPDPRAADYAVTADGLDLIESMYSPHARLMAEFSVLDNMLKDGPASNAFERREKLLEEAKLMGLMGKKSKRPKAKRLTQHDFDNAMMATISIAARYGFEIVYDVPPTGEDGSATFRFAPVKKLPKKRRPK